MNRGKVLAWASVAITASILGALLWGRPDLPPLHVFLFWVGLLLLAELLPVSLGFETRVTMAFPIHIAMEILFTPAAAMLIAGLSAFDLREVRREIPLWRALFNRAQLMLSAWAASSIIHLRDGDLFAFPSGTFFLVLGVAAHVSMNLGLVALMVHTDRRLPLGRSFRVLLPDPVGGFWVLQVVLAALGAATAAVYEQIGVFVSLFLIPLLLARLSLLGARAQQELSERIQQQQKALLDATERVFQERERERHRIAEEIHDNSLQLLAAASYGCGNTVELINADQHEVARQAASGARDAINAAMKALRHSLVDLRKSTVEEGGLMQTVEKFADQLATLWGTEVRIEGRIEVEPPIPVALAAFQILQEGLTNALKHAQSPTVTVTMTDEDGRVHIVVEDHGAGFDLSEEVGVDHVGMRLMRERAARVGGSIELDSHPGRGTRLEAILPGGLTQ